MKLSLILNIAMVPAVALLYVLYFMKPAPGAASGNSSPALAYVNIDTLLQRYTYYQTALEKFEKKRSAMENDLGQRSRSIEEEYMRAQEKARAGNLNQTQMQELEQELLKKQQELLAYKEEREQSLHEENQNMSAELLKNISGYLKEMNREKQYQFVLGYTREGGILLADERLDITEKVTEGLNRKHEGTDE